MGGLLHLLVATTLVVGGCASTEPAPDDAGGPPTTPVAEATTTHGTEVPPLHPSVDGYGERTITITTAEGHRHLLPVKVADTSAERRHGLMEVEELPDGTGMLFVFGDDRSGGFWMKDTLVPLSIAYIRADGSIVEILDMEPCPEGEDCPTYPPSGPYRYALEVPQGWFERVGITAAATVDPG